MFGLVTDDRVFLKTDVQSREMFEKEGAAALRYRARDGTDVTMSYYELPERLYDEPEQAAKWAQTAHDVALRSPTAARKQRKSMTSASRPARRRGRP